MLEGAMRIALSEANEAPSSFPWIEHLQDGDLLVESSSQSIGLESITALLPVMLQEVTHDPGGLIEKSHKGTLLQMKWAPYPKGSKRSFDSAGRFRQTGSMEEDQTGSLNKEFGKVEQSNVDDLAVGSTIARLREFEERVDIIHQGLAVDFEEFLSEVGGEKLGSIEEMRAFRDLVNQILDKLEARLKTPDGHRARLVLTPARNGGCYLRYGIPPNEKRSAGTKVSEIPMKMRVVFE